MASAMVSSKLAEDRARGLVPVEYIKRTMRLCQTRWDTGLQWQVKMEPIHLHFDLTRLQGQSAFITGGASGLGRATAQSWAAAGLYVTIADVQQPVGILDNSRMNYVQCDVTSWDSQIAAFKNAIRFSPTHSLDIVASFAGTAMAPGNQVDHVLAAGVPSVDIDPPKPNIRNIEVNLIGSYYTSWLGLYYLRIQGPTPRPEPSDKSLIFCASIGAYMDSPKASTYPASKFGVRGLFRSTRAQTKQLGIRCNLLAPWFVDTPLIAPIKNAMAARGIDMAKALTFVSIESCVAAASYCVATPDVHGRALAIQPEGTFDLKDDLEDGWAGDQLRPIMQRRRDAGFDA